MSRTLRCHGDGHSVVQGRHDTFKGVGHLPRQGDGAVANHELRVRPRGTQAVDDVAEREGYERDVLYPLTSRGLEINLDDGALVNYLRFSRALQKVPPSRRNTPTPPLGAGPSLTSQDSPR